MPAPGCQLGESESLGASPRHSLFLTSNICHQTTGIFLYAFTRTGKAFSSGTSASSSPSALYFFNN